MKKREKELEEIIEYQLSLNQKNSKDVPWSDGPLDPEEFFWDKTDHSPEQRGLVLV